MDAVIKSWRSNLEFRAFINALKEIEFLEINIYVNSEPLYNMILSSLEWFF